MSSVPDPLCRRACIIVGTLCLIGCNSKADNKSETSAAKDPVADFKLVVNEIQTRAAKSRTFITKRYGVYGDTNKELAGKRFFYFVKHSYSWNIDTFDVQKTDSLMSPFVGIIVITQTEQEYDPSTERSIVPESEVLAMRNTTDIKKRKHTYKFLWQENKWVPERDFQYPVGSDLPSTIKVYSNDPDEIVSEIH